MPPCLLSASQILRIQRDADKRRCTQILTVLLFSLMLTNRVIATKLLTGTSRENPLLRFLLMFCAFYINRSFLWWTLELMRHSKPVRLETAPTPINRDRDRPAPIISLPRFIGGIEIEGRKCLFIFTIHHICENQRNLRPYLLLQQYHRYGKQMLTFLILSVIPIGFGGQRAYN